MSQKGKEREVLCRFELPTKLNEVVALESDLVLLVLEYFTSGCTLGEAPACSSTGSPPSTRPISP